jgi:SAM-dependent methyltransferase
MALFEAIDWYDTPRYYDLIFDEDTDQEADFIEAAMARYVPASKGTRRILEPACGSGRTLTELARRGHRVSGFDASEPMLEFARERLRGAGCKASLRRGVLQEFHYKTRFHLAHCLVSSFKYVLDGPGAQASLECTANCLLPGGVFLLGVHLTDYTVKSRQRERWVVRDGALEVISNTQTWPADRRLRTERVRNRLKVTEDGTERRTETNWHFRTYNARELRALVRSVPSFEIVAVHDFHYDIEWTGELQDDASDVILVLHKRA